MRCDRCPLFASWNNENGSGEVCSIFGDDWGNRFQYEDKHGTVIGCYIEKAYINKVEKQNEKTRKVAEPLEEEIMDCFICGGKGTLKGHRAKINGHFRGKCEQCGAAVME